MFISPNASNTTAVAIAIVAIVWCIISMLMAFYAITGAIYLPRNQYLMINVSRLVNKNCNMWFALHIVVHAC